MMLKKALTSSGKKLLKAIKNMSKARMAKKLDQIERKQIVLQRLKEQQQQQQQEEEQYYLQTSLYEAWESQLSHQANSFESFDSFAVPVIEDYLPENGYACHCCCCHCDEREENQLNENLENEMMH